MSQKTLKALVLEEAFHLNIKDVPCQKHPQATPRQNAGDQYLRQ